MEPASVAPHTRYQLVVFWRDEMRVFDLPPGGEVRIGRADDNDVRIEDASVSRHHALLRMGEKVLVEDLGGANGTFVHDRSRPRSAQETLDVKQLVRQSAEIAIGDSIGFGAANAVVRHTPALELPDLDAITGSTLPGIVVSDLSMRTLYEQALRAAKASISILVLGETGVGKEVLARAIHLHSPRAKGPFMGINCAALTESLLESELFGSEKGAFTGALQARAGLFEASEGGTVFLDEVGELALSTQAKLLRVIEERAVMRLGSNRTRPIDVRFVAATNRNLEADIENGRFRTDLYFRLNGFTISIPPLRERPAEVELLVRSFLVSAGRELERSEPLTVSERALELLCAHAWPGNVRELRNAVERAVALCTGNTILPEHLPPAIRTAPKARVSPVAPRSSEPATSLQADHAVAVQAELKLQERSRIVEALRLEGGNQTKAATRLGISRRTLVTRLAELDVPRPRKRD